jgi:hypothetical protein
MDASPGYELVDPRPAAAEAPYTFFLPPQADLDQIRGGDLVKLMFRGECGVERMWVIVTDRHDDELVGLLDNDPAELPLKLGAPVRFRTHHIISLVPKMAQTHVAPHREYWDRCMVDQCVLTGEEPVEYLYRESPDMGSEGDPFPDSGWRIRGRQSDATDEQMDKRKASYVALGVVLNRDDSWLHLIDAPIGSAFIRNPEIGEYQPLKKDSEQGF